MRGNIGWISLLVSALILSAGPATGGQVAGTTEDALPEEVTGGVVVDLADGDRFKVILARDGRTVWGSRYDASTRSWSDRAVVLRGRNLYCGQVDARAAGTAVAVIAECDEGGYAEDTAPTDSQALYSPDTVTWHSFTLPGEGHEEPGISPSGNAAIWPMHQQWVTWTAGGFQTVRHSMPGQEYTVTGTISDAGDVSLLYGGPTGRGRTCALRVLTVPVAAPQTRQELAVDDACGVEVDLVNVSATEVLFGYRPFLQSRVTITRPDTASPWAVTGIAPQEAPGLVRHRGRGVAATQFVTAPGLPLLAVGSPDRRSFTAQTYDHVAQRWSEPRLIGRSVPECSWGDNHPGGVQLSVIALRRECGSRERVLVSTDAQTWHDVHLGRSPLGVSPAGDYLAASTRSRTLVFSQERGLVRLPLGTRARCDVVSPISPDAAVRLSTTRRRTGWPSVLHESMPGGWRRTDTMFPPSRVGTDRCLRAEVELYESPVSYTFRGRKRAVSYALTTSGTGWKIRRGTF